MGSLLEGREFPTECPSGGNIIAGALAGVIIRNQATVDSKRQTG